MVGDINTLLTVPICHNYQHIGLQPDHIWMRFYHPQYQQDDMNSGYNFYLASIENLAMIQTGHSKGLATSDEQKVLANTVFYVNQLIFNKYQNKDYAAQDTTAPTVPVIINNITKYQFTSEDEGNHYWFYVESYNKDGIAPENYIETSNIAQVDVVTGLAGYYYVIDTSKNTTVTKTGQGVQYINKDVDSIDPGVTNQTRYLHVAAVDNAGNLSGTATIEIPAKLIINYDKNGADGTETMQLQELLAGQSIKIRDNEFTYTRHRFTNWNTDKSNNGDIYKPGDSISYSIATPKYGYNLTLYAIWEQLYKLQVDPNRGKYNESTDIAEYWLSNKEEKTINDATRIGYNFRGWTIDILRE